MIRWLSPNEYEKVIDLSLLAWGTNPSAMKLEKKELKKRVRQIYEELRENTSARVLVLERQEIILGHMTILENYTDIILKISGVYVFEMAIKEGHRGKGIIERLLAFLEEYCKKNEHKFIAGSLSNLEAVKLGTRKGFQLESANVKKFL